MLAGKKIYQRKHMSGDSSVYCSMLGFFYRVSANILTDSNRNKLVRFQQTQYTNIHTHKQLLNIVPLNDMIIC